MLRRALENTLTDVLRFTSTKVLILYLQYQLKRLQHHFLTSLEIQVQIKDLITNKITQSRIESLIVIKDRDRWNRTLRPICITLLEELRHLIQLKDIKRPIKRKDVTLRLHLINYAQPLKKKSLTNFIKRKISLIYLFQLLMKILTNSQ